jgi:DNA mismatch repair ATPase MutS
MSSGKLEEELRRMNDIADHFTPGSLLLFNESFSATNEREGSAIAEEVVRALMEKTAHVFYVTHLYLFAQKIFAANKDWTLFLRAERQADGRRTFKLIETGPLETSYAADLYERIVDGQPVSPVREDTD